MVKLNSNYLSLKETYLFAEIGKRVEAYKEKNPNKRIIKMGIGDVTRPLPRTIVEAMKKACDDMACAETFKGYGPYEGYEFIREKIAAYYKSNTGVDIDISEIFVSEGAKSDVANITDIFDKDNTVLIPDPVYPVYLDTNIMDGRNVVYMPGNEENGFLPMPSTEYDGQIIYLCSPNNPTGAVYTREQLKKWVDYANENQAVILFDAAYESFVTGTELPRSIYEVDGARSCAIEFCSFSKLAGFTGTRCSYTIVPKGIIRDGRSLRDTWMRRQSTKYNGVSYIIQKGAESVFSEEGMKEIRQNISFYKENAAILAQGLDEVGIKYFGGKHSPYIWLKCPDNMGSWELFDYLLNNIGVVGTPGEGFGSQGEGYFRLTSFGSREDTIEATRLLKELFKKN
ncbi:MAG: LL-diaminopimelate aminotransferase [Clostridiales bacterium]|jgi:LL-diaminopimelate aminotransferase|nr:LL-diaminopimelate aminotransferase [Clostridiales bacterium]